MLQMQAVLCKICQIPAPQWLLAARACHSQVHIAQSTSPCSGSLAALPRSGTRHQLQQEGALISTQRVHAHLCEVSKAFKAPDAIVAQERDLRDRHLKVAIQTVGCRGRATIRILPWSELKRPEG